MIDQMILCVLATLQLTVAVLAGQEYLFLLGLGNPDASTGSHTRKYFFALLSLQAFYRGIMLVIETISVNADGSAGAITLPLLVFVRCSPHLLYLSAFSVLVLYWAQICYSLVEHSFLQVRDFVIGLNAALYALAFIAFILPVFRMASPQLLFALFFVSFLAVLCSLTYYYTKLIRLIPGNFVMSKKIMDRMQPLSYSAFAALFLGTVYYAALAISMRQDWAEGYPASYLFIWDFVTVLLIETIPSASLLRLMARDEGDRAGTNGTNGNGNGNGSKRSLLGSRKNNISFGSLSSAAMGTTPTPGFAAQAGTGAGVGLASPPQSAVRFEKGGYQSLEAE